MDPRIDPRNPKRPKMEVALDEENNPTTTDEAFVAFAKHCKIADEREANLNSKIKAQQESIEKLKSINQSLKSDKSQLVLQFSEYRKIVHGKQFKLRGPKSVNYALPTETEFIDIGEAKYRVKMRG